jgi:GAF domain-containing protein
VAAAGVEVLTGVGLSMRIAEEQAVLRRVATLVARATAPEEVFAAVTAEVGRLLKVDFTVLIRYDPDSAVTIAGTWTSTGEPAPAPVGSRLELGGQNVTSLVSQTGRTARLDDYADISGTLGEVGRGWGFCSAVGAPVSVEGRLWGVMIVAYTHEESLPADTEARLAGFTDLVAAAIANAQARVELRGYAEEQAALRRVATLVARATPPEDVFTAVAAEVGRVLSADVMVMSRYDPDGAATIVGAWSSTGDAPPTSVGSRFELGGRNVHTLVFETRRPARTVRVDASGPAADAFRVWDIRAAVGVPISVEGRLWGVMVALSTSEQPMPADTEARLARFTELVATAIANAQARVELRGNAEEQAALRRVATLVARATPPEDVFAAVAAEMGQLLGCDFTVLSRYDPDGAVVVVGGWAKVDPGRPLAVGARLEPGGRNMHALVFKTRRPSRIDNYGEASGQPSDVARDWGFRCAVGAPIFVEDELWGVVSLGSSGEEPLPADSEARLAGFTELVATAIANAQARVELRGNAEEQAALRRVATLVARATPPEDVFAAVAAEVGQLLSVEQALLNRYDPDGTATALAPWTSTGGDVPFPTGTRWKVGGQNVTTLVFRTGRPARIDNYAEATGAAADLTRARGVRSIVGAPITVEGRLWGFLSVMSTHAEPMPADTEARLAGFTELVATALANAEAQAALTASRARIVAAADTTRRRIERDLHDGAQQRLVSLALYLRGAVQEAVPPEAGGLTAQLDLVATELSGVLDELREIARGIHPAVLADGGLRTALKTLARRSAVPVRLDLKADERLPEQIELAAYYVVSEALTNTAKYAHASVIDVQVETGDGVVHVRVRDDGQGGADPSRGSGIIGLKDRVEALGGRISLRSPPGAGTEVEIALPLTDHRLTGQNGP